jgi:hypothetical protein
MLAAGLSHESGRWLVTMAAAEDSYPVEWAGRQAVASGSRSPGGNDLD